MRDDDVHSRIIISFLSFLPKPKKKKKKKRERERERESRTPLVVSSSFYYYETLQLQKGVDTIIMTMTPYVHARTCR